MTPKQEKAFIKRCTKDLLGMFRRRVQELTEQVCSMPGATQKQRDTRDRVMLLLQEFRGWVRKILQTESEDKDTIEENKDFI